MMTPYIILNKKLSELKERNTYLNKRIKELEVMLSSINQHSITMNEMKEIIKDDLSPINNMMKRLKGIEEVMQSEELDTSGSAFALTETEDKRIATGGFDGNISISSHDLRKKEWKLDIYKENAHKYRVISLCILDNNRL